MAQLTPEQEQSVRHWAAEGASLNDIQDRLRREFDVALTYLEARLMAVSLGVKVQEKKKEGPAPDLKGPAAAPAGSPGSAPPQAAGPAAEAEVIPPPAPAGSGKVNVSVDQLAIPGTMASGKAVFSDGKTVSWYLDQFGRLGLKAPEPGYQPPAADIPVFQRELDRALQRAGF